MDMNEFEQWAEENGMGDDLPDTPDRYVQKLDKNEISEEDFENISNKIERYTERKVNAMSRFNETHENIIALFEDDGDAFEVMFFLYDEDTLIKDAANKCQETLEKLEREFRDLDEQEKTKARFQKWLDDEHAIYKECKESIKKRLIDTKRNDVKKQLLGLHEFPIVTDNEDLSYFCNPWSSDICDESLVNRCKEAIKRVKLLKD